MSCTRPPRGWYCTRGTHTGPCAAWPTRWTRLKLRLRGDRFVAPRPAAPAPHPDCRCAR